MKDRVRRTVAALVQGGRVPRSAPWSAPMDEQSPVGEDLLQSPDEPYPGHWRRTFPTPTRATRRRRARGAVRRLPALWRSVLRAHDVAGDDLGTIARRTGLEVPQARAVLNRARAHVWRSVYAAPDPADDPGRPDDGAPS